MYVLRRPGGNHPQQRHLRGNLGILSMSHGVGLQQGQICMKVKPVY